jgi:hypothetical protein
MNKNLNHKGASKRKGAAESKELTEDGPAIDVADKGMAKKKGAAQYVGSEERKQHVKEGKKGNDFNFLPPSKEDRGAISRGKRGFSGISAGNQNLNKDAASNFYDVDQDGDSVFNDYNQDGTAIGRLAKKGYDDIKSGIKWLGASKTGFTQDFGAARQNGYAKGAAKVNSIMNFGAAKAKGAAEFGGKKGDDSKSKKDYEK